MAVSRRQFLEVASAGAVVATLGGAAPDAEPFPTRPFGKTGLTVPILGFGSGSRFLMYAEEDKALEALNRAIDLGINYIDTAHSYGDGKSEERIGKLMASRRKDVVLATKLSARTYDDARRQIDLSLKRLQTDRLDVLHVHALAGDADLAAVEAPDGVLKALYQARDQKVTRAIGVTCHAAPATLQKALERHDFDATQMALNAALARMAEGGKAGMTATREPVANFEALALPVALRKNMGVIAMKVFGQDQITQTAPIDRLLAYSLSLPVSLASCGMPKLEHVEQNARLARQFKPLSGAERKALSDSIAAEKKVAMHAFFRNHADA